MTPQETIAHLTEQGNKFNAFLASIQTRPDDENMYRSVAAFWQYVFLMTLCPPPIFETVATARGDEFHLSWSMAPHHVLLEFHRDGSYDWLVVNGGDRVESKYGDDVRGIPLELLQAMEDFAKRWRHAKFAERKAEHRPIYTSGILS